MSDNFPEAVVHPTVRPWEHVYRWHDGVHWRYRYISRGIWRESRVAQKLLDAAPDSAIAMLMEQFRYAARRLRIAGPKGRLP